MRPKSRLLLLLAGCCIITAPLIGCVTKTHAPIDQKTIKSRRAPRVAYVAPAPVIPRPGEKRATTHVVAKGETLHAVAWRYNLDYRELVTWNRLDDPDLIFVGQQLRLTAPSKPKPSSKTSTPPTRKGVAKKAPVNAVKPMRQSAAGTPIKWVWPARGKPQSATATSRSKGIEIRGTKGQAVKAAAPGTVVYSGSGLRGYGELIIIKHNDTFLSAYAHNDARLANEGSRVNAGETIAHMGSTDAKNVMLHFEIRQNGKAVDPLKFLPKR